jgi:uncharacterized protein (UPF0297 family)
MCQTQEEQNKIGLILSEIYETNKQTDVPNLNKILGFVLSIPGSMLILKEFISDEQ